MPNTSNPNETVATTDYLDSLALSAAISRRFPALSSRECAHLVAELEALSRANKRHTERLANGDYSRDGDTEASPVREHRTEKRLALKAKAIEIALQRATVTLSEEPLAAGLAIELPSVGNAPAATFYV